MNLMLNMKDINKILAKTNFKCKFSEGESQVSLFFASVVSPVKVVFNTITFTLFLIT